MSVPFISRAPTASEVERLRLILSTFADGSGQERDLSGSRPGWRDIERAIESWLGAVSPQNKELFDVLIEDLSVPATYGLSVKSKALNRVSAPQDLATTGRVYMELCNSPAKLWAPLHSLGITEQDFGAKSKAQAIGDSILQTVKSWHTTYAATFTPRTPGAIFDLVKSVYLTVSYAKNRTNGHREYQLHSFELAFPDNLTWAYQSSRCLRARDPAYPNEILLDWYALSGGQLKYYPMATTARYASPRFTLDTPRPISLPERAARYWPVAWKAAKGPSNIERGEVKRELKAMAELTTDQQVQQVLEGALKLL